MGVFLFLPFLFKLKTLRDASPRSVVHSVHLNVSHSSNWWDGSWTLRHCSLPTDEDETAPCTTTTDTRCQCRPGTFCVPDQACEVCKRCAKWVTFDGFQLLSLPLCWQRRRRRPRSLFPPIRAHLCSYCLHYWLIGPFCLILKNLLNIRILHLHHNWSGCISVIC